MACANVFTLEDEELGKSLSFSELCRKTIATKISMTPEENAVIDHFEK